MIIFLISHRNVVTPHLSPLVESHRDNSDEGSQYIFLFRINKNNP